MTYAPEVTAAATRILEGDDSAMAANALEGAIHTYHPFEENLEELLEALALYAPSKGTPYTSHSQVCEAIRQSAVLGDQDDDDARRS